MFVTRTFSKAYGMAGLRVGYAIGDEPNDQARSNALPHAVCASTCRRLPPRSSRSATRRTSIRSARATPTVKAFTVKAFEQMGFKATDSQTNFIFVNINRPAAAFRDACREAGVMVGRDFPPYEKTHCRISIGTKAEMEKAVGVFKKVLGSTTTTANQARR